VAQFESETQMPSFTHLHRILAAGVAAGLASAALAAAAQAARAPYTAHVLKPRPGAARFGSTVRSAAVYGNRVFVSASRGYGLADTGQAQYPVLSTDGGHSWRIDGPQLHVDAADAPEAITTLGAVGRNTVYAYGPSVIDVSSNGGRTWYQIFPEQFVSAVVPGLQGGLAAYLQNGSTIWQYVSGDGGRHWRYSTVTGG
jgi:hypothetical protein